MTRGRGWVPVVALLTLFLPMTACSPAEDPDAATTSVGGGPTAPSTIPSSRAPSPPVSPTGRTPANSAPLSGAGRVSGGWTVTVYYTAVEAFHTEAVVSVTGCPVLECTRGRTSLGRYPADFVDAVRDEGTGRTRAGRYLNWSSDTGFWLDDAPRDSAGRALQPFVSAAADPDVLAAGTAVTVLTCGSEEDGSAVDPAVCARLRQAKWIIRDEFTPGLGGNRHLDLYLGEETGPGFTDGPWYTTLVGAELRTG